MTSPHIQMQMTRLKVFHYLKKVMTEENRCPTAVETGQSIGVCKQTAAAHMRGLQGAAGLPLMLSGRERQNADLQGSAFGVANGWWRDINYIPADRLINATSWAGGGGDIYEASPRDRFLFSVEE